MQSEEDTLTITERIVAALWSAELEERPVGPQSDFFEMGGESLNMVNMLFNVRQRFGVELLPGALFEDSSLRGFCLRIDLLIDSNTHQHAADSVGGII